MRMSDAVHVLISLGSRRRLVRVTIPAWLVRVGLGIAIAGPVLLGYLVIDRSRRIADQRQLAALTRENAILRGKMGFLQTGVDSLRGELSRLAEFDAQLRLSANMPFVSPTIRQMGIGGGLVGSSEPGAEVQSDIDWLLEQTRFQRQSFQKIADNLEKQDYLQNHTPSILPTAGWIVSNYGYRRDPFTGRNNMHNGVDIIGVPGQAVIATADGTVVSAGWYQNWGIIVEIDHGRGIHSFYAHNASVKVKNGDKVKRGQTIATLGRTGRSTGFHCHYGVKVNGSWVNPRKYILSDMAFADSD